ncbi:hypothetical protein CDD83_4108 [Cordyceps sp. RAO-2017]|nr:hypothetical protein CDD83_4108 [Cordyceps sp. RAO-2017]
MSVKLYTCLALGLSLAASVHAAAASYRPPPGPYRPPPGQGIAPPQAFRDLQSSYDESMDDILDRGYGFRCSKDNIGVRRSWDALSRHERREYIRAVKCLHERPAIADPKRAPGNRNRMDDFTYSHINQSLFIHQSALLLPWHRYYVWSFEKALREECGYNGYQPYWDFSRWSNNQLESALLDGSPTSLGGNGVLVPQTPNILHIPGFPSEFDVHLPPGTGGGCVVDGGLVPFNLSLGPVTSAPPPTPGDTFGIQYNPRCLKRNLIPAISRDQLTWNRTMSVLSSTTIRELMERVEMNRPALHGLLHASIGGDIVDFFASPGDPFFYFLHSQLDRLWSIWQAQDWDTRRNALYGTQTLFNIPPSPNATTDTIMELLYAGGKVRIGQAMSTVDGPFCYRYE